MLAPDPGMQQPMPGAQTGGQPMPMPATPTPAPLQKFLHDVTAVTKRTYACAKVEGVPPEEFGIARNARTIADCGYCFHEVIKQQSDLIGQGYDPDQISKLSPHTSTDTTESRTRDTVDEGRFGSNAGGENEATRMIKITEHYVKMDYEGKGKVALYRVTTGGSDGEILRRDMSEDAKKAQYADEIVKVDEIPFAAMTPVIVTHRFFGRSIADLVMDIQRIKTALLRGALDNLYLHNNPRVEVSEAFASDYTMDDLLVSRPGGVVRTKQPGGLKWQVVPDITGSVYPALQYFDSVREWRTGVTRQGQGVDPNALQNQVATIANQMADAAMAKTKLIARIFAETGIKDMFSLLHACIRKNGNQAQTVKLRNKWVNVDPRDWIERDDMTIKVGLGTGSKQQQLAMLQMIMTAQQQAVAIGMVSKKNAHHAYGEMVKLAGHKDIDQWFTLPETPQQPQQPGMPPQPDPNSQPIQPPPDPKQAEIQLKAQHDQAKIQGDMAHQKMKTEGDMAHAQMKTQADIATQNTKTQAEIQLAQQKFELERELKLIDAQIKREQHMHDMQAKAAKHEMDMQTAQVKQAQAKSPKASIEVKHGADEITGPMSDAIGKLGEHVANSQAQTVQTVAAIMEHHAKPKRIRKNKDGSWQTETVT